MVESVLHDRPYMSSNHTGADRGCSYCADDGNMYFGHVEQIDSSDARRTLLLRCPRCRSLHEVRAAGPMEATRLTDKEAAERFPARGSLS
jgi:hypothetical protein